MAERIKARENDMILATVFEPIVHFPLSLECQSSVQKLQILRGWIKEYLRHYFELRHPSSRIR
jgi:hypothetical protein